MNDNLPDVIRCGSDGMIRLCVCKCGLGGLIPLAFTKDGYHGAFFFSMVGQTSYVFNIATFRVGLNEPIADVYLPAKFEFSKRQ